MRYFAWATVSLLACGSGSTFNGFDTPSPSSTNNPPVQIADSGSSTPEDGCSAAAKLVYVVTEENDLYSFDPAALQFTKIGRLDCPSAQGTTPNSMAVDRQAGAWVNYNDGTLWKVSTVNAHCEATPFVKAQHGFGRFGMGFSSNAVGSKEETLFVVGIDNNVSNAVLGQGLATIDLKTYTLNPIGDFTAGLQKTGPELTGTGDGRLYGFFTTNPARLGEIKKATAETPTSQVLAGVTTGNDWAFSFWGGDFWFYTATKPKPSSVTRLHTKTGQIEVVMPNVGFFIVGAGVSTCAPLEIK